MTHVKTSVAKVLRMTGQSAKLEKMEKGDIFHTMIRMIRSDAHYFFPHFEEDLIKMTRNTWKKRHCMSFQDSNRSRDDAD
jgi:hypothetical protein